MPWLQSQLDSGVIDSGALLTRTFGAVKVRGFEGRDP